MDAVVAGVLDDLRAGARQGLVEAKRLLTADLRRGVRRARRRDGPAVRAALPLRRRPGADGRGPAPLTPLPAAPRRGREHAVRRLPGVLPTVDRSAAADRAAARVAAVGGAGQGGVCRPASSRRRPTRRCCSIVPPYLLEALASSDDPHVAAHAQATLDVDAELRQSRRTAGAARRPTASRRRGSGWRPAPPPGPQRAIHDAEHGTTLPGTLVRSEGDPDHRRPGGHRGLRRARRHLAALAGDLRPQLARRQGPAPGRHRALRHRLRQRLLGRHPDGLR